MAIDQPPRPLGICGLQLPAHTLQVARMRFILHIFICHDPRQETNTDKMKILTEIYFFSAVPRPHNK